jgi:Tol biopolymer transport system component
MTNRLGLTCLAAIGALLAVTGTAHAAFPGANGKIVYLREDRRGADVEQSLVAQSPRGASRTVLRRVTDPADVPASRCWLSSPSYSPDGARLAMRACDQLATMNADGTGYRQLPLFSRPEPGANHYAFDASPSWSPDGAHLLFTSVSAYDDGFFPEETDRLAIVNPDGSSPQVLSDTQGAAPQLSTRGVIAYQVGGDVRSIHTIHADGSHARLLLRRADQPEWSPDGRRIAFVRAHWESSHFNYTDQWIYVARANGKGVRRVVHGFYPAWSPNGKRLAFVSGKPNSAGVIWSLYTSRLDGSDRRLLARTDDELVGTDWQPRP